MRYSIKLSYSGAPFRGWQKQTDAPSVQETLETALGTLLGHPVQLTGAGRTDTGVNAIAYIASFDAEGPIDGHFLCYKLNAILPASIAVLDIRQEAPEFHARFDAKMRSYTYFLHRCKDPFVASTSYFYGYPELDFDAMDKAAELLLGTHDFSCFEKTGADNKTSICTVSEAFWKPYTPIHAGLTEGAAGFTSAKIADRACSNYWYFRISADRFLRNMVRAIVGTLLEVGRGKRSIEDFASLILPPESAAPDVNPPECGASPEGHARNDGTSPEGCARDDGASLDVIDREIGAGGDREASGPGRVPATSGPGKPLPPRCRAGESVPGHALFLSGIRY